MLIHLFGPDDFRRFEKRRQIEGEFRKRNPDARLESVSLENGANELKIFFSNTSLFSAKKFASCFIGDNPPAEFSKFAKTLITSPDFTLCIESRKKLPIPFLYAEPVFSQNFPVLEGASWKKYISAEAVKRRISLDASALELLARVYSGDSWSLSTELDKLASFGKQVTSRAVEENGNFTTLNFIETLRSLQSYNFKERLGALERLFASGAPAPKIFNVISAFWKQKTARFAVYDAAVKTGKLEYDEALLDLIL